MSSERAVILDLDGTLVDSNESHARAFVEAAEELGLPVPDVAHVCSLIGMGADRLIPEAFGFAADDRRGTALAERKDEIFRTRYAPDLRPTPGAADLVRRFQRDGYRLVVATSASGDDLRVLLDRVGITDLIDACTSASDVDESKPEPDLVRAALRLAGVPPRRAIMLGDTPYDVEAARRAGVCVVAVRTGGWGDSDLAGAVAVYADPADLLRNYDGSPFRL